MWQTAQSGSFRVLLDRFAVRRRITTVPVFSRAPRRPAQIAETL
jgi:hypothetical protein